LGGNYADHEDPEVDGMSKVIRNALLKVHGEITRRTNAYRSQQGGSAPSVVYLAGAGASLPYLKEVFEEKLRLPVEYFNPLRNITVGPKVNLEQAGADAHTLGELVGLALREMACPMELDLAPNSVKSAKDVGSKKPRLYLAAACLLAGLGSIYAYNKGSAASYLKETNKYQAEVDKLIKYDVAIKEQEKRQKMEEARADYFSRVINERNFWVNMMNALNAQFADEKIWITQISMVGPKGEQTVDKLYSNAPEYPFSTGIKAPGGAVKALTNQVSALHISGINRGNGEDVSTLFGKIRQNLKDYFAFDPAKTDDDLRNDFLINQVGNASTTEGYGFQILLPLKQKLELPVVEKSVTKK